MSSKGTHLQVTLANGQLIGFFDGEYVTSNSGQTLYQVDREKVYSSGNNAKLIGYLEGMSASTVSGEALFTLSN